jgi:primosomal protein N'
VPPSLQKSIQVGSLVSVPFRGKLLPGIVWEMRREEPESKLESVNNVLTSHPLLLQPHRRLIEWLANTGFISLSTALYTWLPTALRSFPSKQTLITLSVLEEAPRTSPGIAGVRQQAAISPFQQPKASAAMQARFPETFWDTFNQQTPKQELESWLQVRIGKTHLVLGRERAIFAPYLNLRHTILAEAEDPSYYHNQLPYLPLQEAVKILTHYTGSDLAIRSNLPAPAGELLWGKPVVSMVKDRHLELVDLRKETILNPDLIAAIQQTVKVGRQVLLVINSYDHKVKGEDGLTTLLPGVQTLTKQLCNELEVVSLPESIHLGTRSILSNFHQAVGLTVMLRLDSQLNPQCFADEVSLWTDVGSLMAYPCPCKIQVANQDHPFIHALRNQQVSSYTQEVLSQRFKAGLPPSPGVIFLSLTASPQAEDELTALKTKLEPLLRDWQLSGKLERSFRKQETISIALIPPAENSPLPTAVVKLLASLKRPWKVQVGSWQIL